MSDSTARAIRLTKAQGMREAAERIAGNKYAVPIYPYQRDYNAAMQDAADQIVEMADELEASE